MKKLFFIIFIVYSHFSNGQKNNNFLDNKGKKYCEENREILCKTFQFYKQAKFDSCYTYSSKGLLLVNNTDDKDFLNYLQAYSAYTKGLYLKAKKNLNTITQNKGYDINKSYLLGTVYLRLKDYDNAIKSIENWFNLNKDAKAPYKKIMYHNLATCYIHKKEYEKAKHYFGQKLELLNPIDTSSVIKFKTDVANVYYSQYLDDKAISLFREAYELSKSYSNVEIKQNAAKNMAVVERNRKNYEASVKYYQEYNTWKDSLWNRDRVWELAEKDKQFAVAQKQQEIALQEAEVKRQKTIKNSLFAGAGGLLVFIAGLGYFYRRLKHKNILINEQKNALAEANATKNYLFSVVSHDLRSPINTIKRQHKHMAQHIASEDLSALKEVNEAAISVTESTSHLLNNVLHWSLEQSNQLLFSQQEENLNVLIKHVLYDYKELARIKEVAITTDYQDDVLTLVDKESFKIVLRNLIDNAIKYMNGAGSIHIKTFTKGAKAYVCVEDTGIGMSAEQVTKINSLNKLSVDKIDRSKGVGLGVLLCQTLIKRNSGTLTFTSEQGKGTKITIELAIA